MRQAETLDVPLHLMMLLMPLRRGKIKIISKWAWYLLRLKHLNVGLRANNSLPNRQVLQQPKLLLKSFQEVELQHWLARQHMLMKGILTWLANSVLNPKAGLCMGGLHAPVLRLNFLTQDRLHQSKKLILKWVLEIHLMSIVNDIRPLLQSDLFNLFSTPFYRIIALNTKFVKVFSG